MARVKRTYRFADALVQSNVELPELARLSVVPRDEREIWSVEFESRELDPCFEPEVVVEQEGHVVVRQRSGPDGVIVRLDNRAEYELSVQAHRVRVAYRSDVALAEVRRDTLNQILPRVLSAAGHFVIHASGVLTPHGAVLFLGPSGTGKSSIAAHFDQQPDAELLGDDCLVLTPVGDKMSAISTYRSLRLLPDSVAYLRGLSEQPVRADAMIKGDKKKQVEVGQPVTTTKPTVAAIVVLHGDGASNEAPSLVELSQRDAALALVRNSFRLDVAGSASLNTAFDKATHAAAKIPGLALRYERSYEQLSTVYDLVMDRLRPTPG